jgi:hypothetical protein
MRSGMRRRRRSRRAASLMFTITCS